MGTRSVIARPTPEGGFCGIYCHYDGYPAHQGRVLFEAVTGHFGGDTDAACSYLIDQHPAGWSVLHGDFTTPPGYRLPTDPDDLRNQCYCHGDRHVDIVANRLPRRFGLNPAREVQVLCPMHRGPAGAGVLNERLQAALTPGRDGLAERRFGGRVYRVGDKVMQIRNNYDKGTAGVFNGSVGVVTALSLEDSELRVRLDEDEEVSYGFEELDELTHAYAVSIHRSQGSEYPCVVVPLTMSAWMMLQRNLLYTAVTRPKHIVVLVGSKRALAKAVRTQGAGRRYTALTQRLQQGRMAAITAAGLPAATHSDQA